MVHAHQGLDEFIGSFVDTCLKKNWKPRHCSAWLVLPLCCCRGEGVATNDTNIARLETNIYFVFKKRNLNLWNWKNEGPWLIFRLYHRLYQYEFRLPLSLTHSPTSSCFVNLIDLTLACEDARCVSPRLFKWWSSITKGIFDVSVSSLDSFWEHFIENIWPTTSFDSFRSN